MAVNSIKLHSVYLFVVNLWIGRVWLLKLHIRVKAFLNTSTWSGYKMVDYSKWKDIEVKVQLFLVLRYVSIVCIHSSCMKNHEVHHTAETSRGIFSRRKNILC